MSLEARKLDTCEHAACDHQVQKVRMTASGYPVGYCNVHAVQADILFGHHDLKSEPKP